MQDQEYELLVANIYRAGAGRMPWTNAFKPLMTALDLWGVQLLGVDKKVGTLLFSYDTGNSPTAFLDYLRSYHQINPRILPSLCMTLDDWMHDHEHFDDEYVAQSVFYQDFVIPHGSRYLSGTKIVEDDQTLVLFGAMRGLGKTPLARREIDVLNRIKRHLVEAMKNYLHLRVAHSELSAGRQLLNHFRYPMFLVDEQRGIRFRNEAAVQELKSTRFIVDRHGAIGCRDPNSDLHLTIAIRELGLSDADNLQSKSPRRSLRIKDTDGLPIAVIATALRPDTSMAAFGQMPLALLVFHDPMQQTTLDPFIVAETFDLTPAEARVCVGLVGAMSPDAIARANGVAISTVRSQIKAIYSKTGTQRQSELVRLLTNLSGFNPMQPHLPAN